MPDDPFPTVATDRLEAEGWVLAERASRTVLSLPTIAVTGHTLLYERPEPRGEDRDPPTRFFFATRLAFDPPLSHLEAVGVLPVVRMRSLQEFATTLERRGLTGVSRGRARRLRTDAGDRVRFTRYTARLVSDGPAIPIEAWAGVWLHDEGFRFAGGGYPAPSEGSDVATPREGLFALIRAVE